MKLHEFEAVVGGGEGRLPLVEHHVEHHPVGVLDEKAPYAPRLLGQRMHHLHAAPHRLGMHGVDV
jgi:hypothetical protein